MDRFLVHPESKLNFRYLDARRSPFVYGLTTAFQRNELRRSETSSSLLVTPLKLMDFHDIQRKSVGSRKDEMERARQKNTESKRISRKWDPCFTSMVDNQEIQGEDRYLNENNDDEKKGTAILTFMCPAHAKIQAQLMRSCFSLNIYPIEILLTDAKYLSERMNLPLSVVISAWCDAHARRSHAEIYLRMPNKS